MFSNVLKEVGQIHAIVHPGIGVKKGQQLRIGWAGVAGGKKIRKGLKHGDDGQGISNVVRHSCGNGKAAGVTGGGIPGDLFAGDELLDGGDIVGQVDGNPDLIQGGVQAGMIGLKGGSQQVDEIYFGNTVFAVEVIPEPATLSLVAVGGLILLALRRK